MGKMKSMKIYIALFLLFAFAISMNANVTENDKVAEKLAEISSFIESSANTLTQEKDKLSTQALDDEEDDDEDDDDDDDDEEDDEDDENDDEDDDEEEDDEEEDDEDDDDDDDDEDEE